MKTVIRWNILMFLILPVLMKGLPYVSVTLFLLGVPFGVNIFICTALIVGALLTLNHGLKTFQTM